MLKKLGFRISKSVCGFKRYIRWQRQTVIFEYEQLDNSTYYLRIDEIERYMSLRRVLVYDNRFFSCLDSLEKDMLTTMIKQEKMSNFGNWLFNKIYTKWISVFFGGQPIIKELDKSELAIVLRKIRESKCLSVAQLAREMDVNRKTIFLVEKGQRFPSLVYIYNFSKICQIEIDKIIEMCGTN